MSASEEPLRLASVDLGAIRHNVRTVAALVGGAEVMAVVKANAYGHGAVEVARAAVEAGATWLGVADVDEAVALRDAGLSVPVLAWLHSPQASFDRAVAHSIDVGVSSVAQLDAVAAAGLRVAAGLREAGEGGAAQQPARVHLKLDTGLGRNGAEQSLWPAFFARAAELQRAGQLTVVGLFSHLSNTNDEEDRAQLERLLAGVELARVAQLEPPIIHLASTAAALRLPETRLSMIRLGIGMYGLSPFDDQTSAELGLRPAMRVEGRVISVKRVPVDSGVSYGYTYRTATESTLALVALGYADGIPRLGSNRAPVWINGEIHRVSGRIAMDQFVADVHDAEAAVGDRVVLFGDPQDGYPSAEDWAEAAETINYEIVTRIGARIERRYVS
ncbi:alanine racemase [Subtercola boreus]|uniref:Alanine racemase n=1 Tax=Subtercola boreus TaxID=120213 RepID=A0A3E0W877_9MICO|nr:alanine racemase [Subtercola boreus]RFA19404.1 alanine racemase [Subtercola boreus]RFA19665.1 alanine racemase [Subtercola boreus]RFA26030.1 alanine racemase [Subtercola boreus]